MDCSVLKPLLRLQAAKPSSMPATSAIRTLSSNSAPSPRCTSCVATTTWSLPRQRPSPIHLRFAIEGWHILLVHDIADVPALLDDRVKLVITGHSHKPRIEWRGDMLYLNPGSAGRRRFKLPVTLALLEISADSMEPSLVRLVD